jgi:hypothetical protein
MESQKEGGFGPPRAVTPWKKKKKNRTKGGQHKQVSLYSRYIFKPIRCSRTKVASKAALTLNCS